jgi:hypothetical protein
MIESLIARPDCQVQEAEYRRLLGYPRNHLPGEWAQELSAWARQWYAEHGRPWVYFREAELVVTDASLRLDGREFRSEKLHEHLRGSGCRRAMLVAVSAGRACEEHARRLWQDAKPDEYFFLEIFGSAVVEHLVAATNGRLCDLAERDGLIAVPHYSPGYNDWDVAEQNKLFDLIVLGAKPPLPEPLEVLPSGMLRPKKSLLCVFGLAPRDGKLLGLPQWTPCRNCSFTPCKYRRVPYRGAPAHVEGAPPAEAQTSPRPPEVKYSVNPRALQKWTQERVRLHRRGDGTVEAHFRFDGTTCSNLGRPLAFDYRVTLSALEQGCTILQADCRPAPGDEGHTQMCTFLSDAANLMQAVAHEKPLLGRPLREVFNWQRTPAPAGCLCTADSRAHKWGLVFEVIHYALGICRDGSRDSDGARANSTQPAPAQPANSP